MRVFPFLTLKKLDKESSSLPALPVLGCFTTDYKSLLGDGLSHKVGMTQSIVLKF